MAAVPGELLSDPETTQRIRQLGPSRPETVLQDLHVLGSGVDLERQPGKIAEPLFQISRNALRERSALGQVKIGHLYVVGLDDGVRIDDAVERAHDQPGTTARLGISAAARKELRAVEILGGACRRLLARNTADQDTRGIVERFIDRLGRRVGGRCLMVGQGDRAVGDPEPLPTPVRDRAACYERRLGAGRWPAAAGSERREELRVVATERMGTTVKGHEPDAVPASQG